MLSAMSLESQSAINGMRTMGIKPIGFRIDGAAPNLDSDPIPMFGDVRHEEL
jgi:hypothetical protein